MEIEKDFSNYSRRDFLATAATACVAFSIPKAAIAAVKKIAKQVTIGVITDLHQDVMHDAPQRLKVFLQHMKKIRPDALLQMGDFAYPGDINKEVIDLFNKAHTTRMHVIGNHDTDAGYKKEQCISYWGMPGRYYTQTVNGIAIIVLDGNDNGSPTHKGGYASYINPEQIAWLKEKLNEVTEPVIIVSHQPLAGERAIDNAAELQEILSGYSHKILMSINGHSHINSLLHIKGVNYLHINSASYFWVGGKYLHDTYPKEMLKDHKYLSHICPYKDALFATVTIDPVTLTLSIKGSGSEWIGQSPAALGYNEMETATIGEEIAPKINDRKIEKVIKK
jgi:calcineurin-like phosphoesterase family protein